MTALKGGEGIESSTVTMNGSTIVEPYFQNELERDRMVAAFKELRAMRTATFNFGF